jgi:hypothetical protein
MWHPKTVEFDNQMKKLFDEVDDYLEALFGNKYTLHPSRQSKGRTSNPEADGLFNIGANFTPGFGSELGRGYVVDLSIVTLDKVDEEGRNAICEAAAEKIKELLPVYFPGRELTIQREKNQYKILGDFSLGEV